MSLLQLASVIRRRPVSGQWYTHRSGRWQRHTAKIFGFEIVQPRLTGTTCHHGGFTGVCSQNSADPLGTLLWFAVSHIIDVAVFDDCTCGKRNRSACGSA